MPRCERCGAEYPEGAVFCFDCGQNLEEEAPESATALQGPPPSEEEQSKADRLLTEAFAMSDQGRLSEAVRLAQQALSYNPKSTTAHSLLGTVYERLGNRDAAIREYQTVLSLSPGSTADRERLNELLGMPAAPQAAPVPSAPRMVTRRKETPYIIAVAVVSILAAIGIIVIVFQSSGQRPPRESATLIAPTRRTPADTEARPRSTAAALPLAGMPSAGDRGGAAPALPDINMPSLSFGSGDDEAGVDEGMGDYAYDFSSEYEDIEAEPYEAPVVLDYPGHQPPEVEEIRFLPGGGKILSAPPTIRTPAPRARRVVTAARSIQPNIRAARQYVTSGRLQEAKQVYEAALAADSIPAPRVRQELATVYFRLNEPAKSAEQFMQAYDAYLYLLEQGAEGIEAQEAEHGLATCEAALRALGVE